LSRGRHFFFRLNPCNYTTERGGLLIALFGFTGQTGAHIGQPNERIALVIIGVATRLLEAIDIVMRLAGGVGNDVIL